MGKKYRFVQSEISVKSSLTVRQTQHAFAKILHCYLNGRSNGKYKENASLSIIIAAWVWKNELCIAMYGSAADAVSNSYY